MVKWAAKHKQTAFISDFDDLPDKMATTSTRNVGTVTKGKSGISEAEKEEKIQKAQQKAQNSKPGSLASKANLVSRYNSGQQTNQPKAEDESSSKEKKGKKK